MHYPQISALEAEVLEGSNQYACELCQCKVDAIRQMVLRTLPPYLCLQLNRFVFDLEVCVWLCVCVRVCVCPCCSCLVCAQTHTTKHTHSNTIHTQTHDTYTRPQTMNKAKASNKFAFPLELDMGTVMASVATV